MRILHFSTEDISGGAARAAFRLHGALRDAGQHSHMFVRRKKSYDDDVNQLPPPPPRPWQSRLVRILNSVPGLRKPRLSANYTFNFDLEPQINTDYLFKLPFQQGDIICLHWISELLNSRLIRELYNHYHCKVVWVMADQEPMTGGCHYSFGCDGYRNECGCCPMLDSEDKNDHSHYTWRRKKSYLTDMPICFVAPTSWGIARLRESSLFQNNRVELIPYAIDTEIFRPVNQQIARDLLHLPFDKKIIFFGATYLEDRRKGMKQLIETIEKLVELIDASGGFKREDIFLVAAGLNGKGVIAKLPLSGKYVGHLNDEITLALAYQAADIFLCPSIEDAGPMMIPEAMLCGTPVVAFNAGGAPDLIRTMKNGYLADLGDTSDLAAGIYALLTSDILPAMRLSARQAAEQAHMPSIVAGRHINLYQSL